MSSNYSEISKSNLSFVDGWLAYAVFRFTLRINIFIHGVGRVLAVGAREFATKTSSEFAGTALPHGLVYAFLIALPFAEVILGALMIFGLLTRWTLTLAFFGCIRRFRLCAPLSPPWFIGDLPLTDPTVQISRSGFFRRDSLPPPRCA
jgi:hypothetical protein